MEQYVIDVIQDMFDTTVAFVGSFVGSLWGILLSLAVLAFAGAFILRKTGIGRR